MTSQSKNLFVSLSCDDISIRQHLWFTGSTFYGYEDIGEGPGKNPAKHVMMLMVTSLNMDWKLPVAYFLLSDNFKAKTRAELIRQCLLKLNSTGAIVTNVVMDNCPVNYATYRLLGCKLGRKCEHLDTSTDIVNNLGENVVILFDPPHLSKLGHFFSHNTLNCSYL